MGNFLSSAWSMFRNNLSSVLSTFNFVDVLDIVIVAFLFYQLMRLVRETRAMQLVKGIGAIVALYFFATALEMSTLTFFLYNILTSGVIVLAIVFQPELRRALEQVGRTKLSPLSRVGDNTENRQKNLMHMITAIVAAASSLSSGKTGALMVIERETKLGDVIKTGTEIDAVTSPEMIENLFFPNSPLHDGAVILREGRLHAAGCFLPLSANMDIGRELGTRHRAALGMSEVSDAVVVVVSEETGAISVALESRLQRGLSPKNLQRILELKIIGQKNESGAGDAKPESKKTLFGRKKP